jgi:putative adenylate-forming enzyme
MPSRFLSSDPAHNERGGRVSGAHEDAAASCALLLPLRVLWKRAQLERSTKWSRAELLNHQQEELVALRRFALERSPFYERFHKGLENKSLAELPILTKATMMENFENVVTDREVRLNDVEAHLRQESNPLFRDRYVVLATSGSTGRHGVFLFDKAEWITALASITRPLAWAGVATGFRPPKSAMIASRTSWHYSARVGSSLATRLLPTLRLDAADGVAEMVRKLNDWQPVNLGAYPSVLKELAEEQIAGRLRIKLSSAACSAEVLTEETRRRVKEAWGIRVFDTYGATEYAPIAAECLYGKKHLFEDGAIIEIVDEKGKAVPAGETGDKLLLTIFRRYTQPLIRYELSDMVRPTEGQCPCGRKFQVIEAVEGRIEDVLHFPSLKSSGETVSVHPNVFHQALEVVPAAGWQVAQQENGIVVRLQGLKEETSVQGLESSIRALLEAQNAAVPTIEIALVDALERGATGKAALILSRRRPSGNLKLSASQNRA